MKDALQKTVGAIATATNETTGNASGQTQEVKDNWH